MSVIMTETLLTAIFKPDIHLKIGEKMHLPI